MGSSNNLTQDDLYDLASAALDNSIQLLKEAKALLGLDSTSRAYALGVLSGEELGKCLLCIGSFGMDGNDEATLKEFWKKFKSHEAKLGILHGHYVDMTTKPGVEQEEWKEAWDNRHGLATSTHQSKMRSLYVDFNDGQVRHPRDNTSHAEAEEIIKQVSLLIDLSAPSISEAIEARIASTPELQELFKIIHESDDPMSSEDHAKLLDWISRWNANS